MPGNLGKSSLAILYLLSSSVKCGTTLADQGHFVQERSNLWLFISSENQPWNHQEREPTTTKKRVDLSFFFFKKRQKTWTRTEAGNDSCDVYLILSNSGKYLRELKINQVSANTVNEINTNNINLQSRLKLSNYVVAFFLRIAFFPQKRTKNICYREVGKKRVRDAIHVVQQATSWKSRLVTICNTNEPQLTFSPMKFNLLQ